MEEAQIVVYLTAAQTEDLYAALKGVEGSYDLQFIPDDDADNPISFAQGRVFVGPNTIHE
jgi:hypothetical protein